MRRTRLGTTLAVLIGLLSFGCGPLTPTATPTEFQPDTPTPTPTDTPEPPTPDATAGWPVYHNTVLGYSFKYPPDCYFGPMAPYCKNDAPEDRPPECPCFLDTQDPTRVFMQAFLGDPQQGLTLASFYVDHFSTPAFNPPPGTDLVTWVQSEWGFIGGAIPPAPNYTLGGVPAVLVYVPGSPQAFATNHVFVIESDRLFHISMVDVDVAVHLELYDNILSTFEFTP